MNYLRIITGILIAATMQICTSRANADTNSTVGYYILTTTNIIDTSLELTNFIAHREMTGFNVELISNTVWGAGIGDAAANNMRSWLQNNWTNAGGTQAIEYVLLIGNPHPSSGDVPMKICYPEGAECPTDYFYAELTCNWNLDGDSKWGEWDDDFNFSNDYPTATEIYVGRIPYYGSISNLDSILRKLMRYEDTSQTNLYWRSNTLLPMDKNGISMDTAELGEWIKEEALIPAGCASYRIYDSDGGYYPDVTPCTRSTTVTAWTNLPFGCVAWFCHGYTATSCGVLDISDVPKLNDNSPGFIFQGDCNTAKPEVSNNLGYSLLLHGAINTIGATRFAYYSGGTSKPWIGSNTRRTPGMEFGYIWGLVVKRLSSAESLQLFRETHDPYDKTDWMNHIEFNVYGDPAMGLYSTAGNAFTGTAWGH